MNTAELALVRFYPADTHAAGRLYWNGEFLCNTLEDPVREVDGLIVSMWKKKGITAIPRGRYQVVLTQSPRFGRLLPELLNVNGYTAIRMHSGNKVEDTEGCLLIGMPDGKEKDNWLGNSKAAEVALVNRLKEAHAKMIKTFITVV